MPRFRLLDGVRMQFTAEEEAEADVQQALWDEGTDAREFAVLRSKRNALLAATDWWASSDLSITQDQKLYRQALRDLPANTADPLDITWPEEPE